LCSVGDAPRIDAGVERGFVVSGLSGWTNRDANMAELNGPYWPDGWRTDRTSGLAGLTGKEEKRGHKHVRGKWTIWYASVLKRWFISDGYTGTDYYRCYSASPTPPLTGWEATMHGTEPPPRLSHTTPAQARPLPAPAAAAARGCCRDACE
jgi:hypothetical protein